MSKSKKQKRNNNKVKKIYEKFNNEIIGMIIIALGILILISLFSLQMGIIGKLIKRTTFILMGLGAYIFPVFVIGIGTIFLLDKYDKKELKTSIILLIVLLSVLVLLDSKNISVKGFVDRVKLGNHMSIANKDGGVIGSFLGFFFYNLFGKIGGYLILFFISIITFIVFMEIKIKDIVNYIKKIATKKNVKINNKVEKDLSSKKKIKIQKKDLKDRKSKNENIKILEYNDTLNNNKKTKIDNNTNVQTKDPKSQTNKVEYVKPPIELLNDNISKKNPEDKKEILNNAQTIEETMSNFGIDATITQINKGPTITCYELLPSPGIKLSKIVSLNDNIALSLAASDIRIEAPIPGKAAIGIEVPNKNKDNVYLKEILLSNEFKNIESDVPLALGKDVSGTPIISSIDKMPHLLIAGATGSGKSVCINTIITSIIYKSSPDKVKLLLIDPKVVELSIYNDIPHLLIPVVTDAKKAAFALNWAVEEMEERYNIFAKYGARDIHGYNRRVKNTEENEMPMIVIIIDELADLMMVAAQEIEDYISRLAQKARAAGIYLIVATQRPSVDVITGTIKANIPSRLSFAVSSQVDSRTILDMGGAEKLLGHGDMLFSPSFYSKPLRVQGTFVSDKEIEKIVGFLKNNYQGEYDEEVIDIIEKAKKVDLNDTDELLTDAIELVVSEEQASISMLQRRLRIGYARAARIIDEMELRGIVGGHEGSKPRKVLISKEDMKDLDNL